MIEKTGQGQDTVSGQEVFTAMAVIGKVNVPDTAGLVEQVEVIDKVGLARSHVGAVKGQVEVVLVNEIYHVLGIGHNMGVDLESADPGHILNGYGTPHLFLKIIDTVEPAPETDLEPHP